MKFVCKNCGKKLKPNLGNCPNCNTSTSLEFNNGSSLYLNKKYKEYLKGVITKDKIFYLAYPDGFVIKGINAFKLLDDNVSIDTIVEDGEILLYPKINELLYQNKFNDIKYIFDKLPNDTIEKSWYYYLKLFLENEKEKCRKELEKFNNSKVKNIGLNINNAIAYKILFNENEKAKKCLKETEGKTHFSYELTDCCIAWKLIFDNDKEARRCLKKAERIAKLTDEWTSCAEIWKKVFNDSKETKRCIKKAEKNALVLHDWIYCAQAWKQLFNNNIEASKYIKKAENDSNYTFEWTRIARSWKEILNSDIDAKKCLKEAERKAIFTFDWTDCANTWKQLFGNKKEVKRCEKKAIEFLIE